MNVRLSIAWFLPLSFIHIVGTLLLRRLLRRRALCLRRSLAPEALGGELRALRERLELGPGDLRVHASAEPAIGRGDDVVAADRLGEVDDPVRHELGML